MVSVCLPSDALLQHLPSYLGSSYLRREVSLHGCSSKVQLLLLTLDKGYLLTAASPDLERGVAPLGHHPWPWAWGNPSLPTSIGSLKKQESSRKTSISALLTMPKPFDCVDHNKLWKILKEMGIPDHLTCLLRNFMQVRKQQLELDMEQQTGSK